MRNKEVSLFEFFFLLISCVCKLCIELLKLRLGFERFHSDNICALYFFQYFSLIQHFSLQQTSTPLI